MKFDKFDLAPDGRWVVGYMKQFEPRHEHAIQLQFDTEVGNVLRWCEANTKDYYPMTQRNSVRVPRMLPDDCTFLELEIGKMLIMQVHFVHKKHALAFKKHWG